MFVQSEHAGKKTLTEKDLMKRSYELQEGPVLNGFFQTWLVVYMSVSRNGVYKIYDHMHVAFPRIIPHKHTPETYLESYPLMQHALLTPELSERPIYSLYIQWPCVRRIYRVNIPDVSICVHIFFIIVYTTVHLMLYIAVLSGWKCSCMLPIFPPTQNLHWSIGHFPWSSIVSGGRWDLALHILEDARSMGPNGASKDGFINFFFAMFKGWHSAQTR